MFNNSFKPYDLNIYTNYSKSKHSNKIRYIDDLFVTNNKLVLKLKKDGQHYIKDSLECVKNLDFVENAYRLTPSML